MYRIYIYHESFEVEKFCGLCGILHVHKFFLYKGSRWCCSNMDLRESMWDSMKVFREGLHIQLAAKPSWFVYSTYVCSLLIL